MWLHFYRNSLRKEKEYYSWCGIQGVVYKPLNTQTEIFSEALEIVFNKIITSDNDCRMKLLFVCWLCSSLMICNRCLFFKNWSTKSFIWCNRRHMYSPIELTFFLYLILFSFFSFHLLVFLIFYQRCFI